MENRTKTGVFSPASLEQVGPGDVGERLVVFEVTVRPVAAGVDDPLGNALMVEVEDLLPEVEVLQQTSGRERRPERVLIVGDGHPLLGVNSGCSSPAAWCVSPPEPTETSASP